MISRRVAPVGLQYDPGAGPALDRDAARELYPYCVPRSTSKHRRVWSASPVADLKPVYMANIGRKNMGGDQGIHIIPGVIPDDASCLVEGGGSPCSLPLRPAVI
ncbi:uncharacterized protein PG998_005976 [Apiospora kogelbergensis]|uniref:uncharacterized protein n=1 Tax=Apiospora kogelbergensis TaxID=1337665 RepID=UPI003130E8BB